VIEIGSFPDVRAMQNVGTPRSMQQLIDWVKENGGEAWQSTLDGEHKDLVIRNEKEQMMFLARPGHWVIHAGGDSFFTLINAHFRALYQPKDAQLP
jgi:hypothetical protein